MRTPGTPNTRTQLGQKLIGPLLPDLIEYLGSVALGRAQQGIDVVTGMYDRKDRLEACKILLSYGLSKPAQAVAVTGGQDEDGNDVPVGIAVKFV